MSHRRTMILGNALLQLLDHDRRSSASSVANACQSVLARLQVVHHVTHDSGPRHPDGGRVTTRSEVRKGFGHIAPPTCGSSIIMVFSPHPMGCPRDTAPPLTFTFAGSMSSILMLASTTTLKASLISHMAMSSFFRPAASRA